jgi:hypothetical protein
VFSHSGKPQPYRRIRPCSSSDAYVPNALGRISSTGNRCQDGVETTLTFGVEYSLGLSEPEIKSYQP